MLFFNGSTATAFIIFGTIFGLHLFTSAHKINAKILKYMGLNILFATWCYSGYMVDFFSVIIWGENVPNTNGWIGIIGGMWLAIALIFAVYVGAELFFPNYKVRFTSIFIVIAIIFEFFLFFETNSSLGFIYPTTERALINFYVNFYTPLGIIVIFYYLTLFFLLAMGFLYKSLQTKGIAKK